MVQSSHPDIVERLRTCYRLRELPTWGEIYEAADRIEELMQKPMTDKRSEVQTDEPVCWIVLAKETDNVRIWWRRKEMAEEWAKTHNAPLIQLYAHPRCADAILPLASPPRSEGVRASEVRTAEPVAWMGEWDGNSDATTREYRAEDWKRLGRKVTPLYSHPAQAGFDPATIEHCAKIAENRGWMGKPYPGHDIAAAIRALALPSADGGTAA